MDNEILIEKFVDLNHDEIGPISIMLRVRRDDVGLNVTVEGSLWQNQRDFIGPVNTHFDNGNLEISARLS